MVDTCFADGGVVFTGSQSGDLIGDTGNDLGGDGDIVSSSFTLDANGLGWVGSVSAKSDILSVGETLTISTGQGVNIGGVVARKSLNYTRGVYTYSYQIEPDIYDLLEGGGEFGNGNNTSVASFVVDVSNDSLSTSLQIPYAFNDFTLAPNTAVLQGARVQAIKSVFDLFGYTFLEVGGTWIIKNKYPTLYLATLGSRIVDNTVISATGVVGRQKRVGKVYITGKNHGFCKKYIVNSEHEWANDIVSDLAQSEAAIDAMGHAAIAKARINGSCSITYNRDKPLSESMLCTVTDVLGYQFIIKSLSFNMERQTLKGTRSPLKITNTVGGFIL